MRPRSSRDGTAVGEARSLPRIRSWLLRPWARSSWPSPRHRATPAAYTAVEMTRAWKSQNDFHTRLEISHRTRDSHISTSRLSFFAQKNEDKDTQPDARRCAVMRNRRC